MTRKLLLSSAACAIAVLLVFALAASGDAHSGARPARGARAHPHQAAQASTPGPAVRATNRLALALLARLGGAGNVVFSPYSIQAALSMIDQGAAGGTATQLGHVLGTQDASALGAAEAALSSWLRDAVTPAPGAVTTKADRVRLSVANGLWVRAALALESSFQIQLARDFGADPQTLKFGSDPDGARQVINNWVAGHTSNLIKNLMPPGSISPETQLVLANAIYLKALWASPFIRSMTADGMFHTSPGRSERAPFMTQDPLRLGYARTPAFQAVDLPYRDSTLSMLAIMPAAGTLAQFERRLTPSGLGRIADSLSERDMVLRMPRFKLALHTELNGPLSALGMPLAFSDAADFSRITRSTGLKIEDVEHGAYLDVNEAGTTAAAATGISIEPTALQAPPPLHVILDRPFLLFLRDQQTGAVMFAARVTDPAVT